MLQLPRRFLFYPSCILYHKLLEGIVGFYTRIYANSKDSEQPAHLSPFCNVSLALQSH